MTPRAYWDDFGCSNDDLDRFVNFHYFDRVSSGPLLNGFPTLRAARVGVPRQRLWFYMCDAAPKTRSRRRGCRRAELRPVEVGAHQPETAAGAVRALRSVSSHCASRSVCARVGACWHWHGKCAVSACAATTNTNAAASSRCVGCSSRSRLLVVH